MKQFVLLFIVCQACACTQTPGERELSQAIDVARTGWRAASTGQLLKAAIEATVRITEGERFPRRYRVIRHLSERVYVSNASSEADAELRAFYMLVLSARAANARDIISVEREILENGLNIDRRRIDNVTTAKYLRGLGNMSTWPTDISQDQPRVLARSVRFSATAVAFE
jgi:hypothetical protein